MDFAGKVVVVVGASSGIGRVVALQLAAEGATVVAVARRAERLRELARQIAERGGTCDTFAADALDEAQSEQVVAEVIRRWGRIDALLLNAGGAPALDMRRMGAAEVNSYMRSNYDVAVNYLFPTLEHMKRQRSGLVAITNSVAGLLGVPLQGPYCAAKGALSLLADTCRVEFQDHGIAFVSVYPGFVSTEATTNDGMEPFCEVTEARAASEVLYAMRRELPRHVFPRRLRWLVRLTQILPVRLLQWVLGRDLRAHDARRVTTAGLD